MDLSTLPVRDGFRQRGAEITRLETFTDAAFAFAVTVLAIWGGELPTSFDELMASLKEIPAFVVSFALIVMFWHGHVVWSRRFGLEDTRSVFLSAALVLTVLVYMVPLKVLFGQMFAWMSGGWLGTPFELKDPRQLPPLFVVYGVGYTVMCALMALLNAHAHASREELRLDVLEAFETRITVWQWVLLGLPGIASTVVAAVAPPQIGVWSGFCYAVLPIVMPIFGVIATRRWRALQAEAEA